VRTEAPLGQLSYYMVSHGEKTPGGWRSRHDGWSNGAVVGKADVLLKRVVAHWFDLPDFHGPLVLTRTTEAGEHWWMGRWQMEVGWMEAHP
jgi:hypothetical protein